jgi:hypothetical protein
MFSTTVETLCFINMDIDFASSVCFCGAINAMQGYGTEGQGFADHHRQPHSSCPFRYISFRAADKDQPGGNQIFNILIPYLYQIYATHFSTTCFCANVYVPS